MLATYEVLKLEVSTVTSYASPKTEPASVVRAVWYAFAESLLPFKKATVVSKTTDPSLMLLIATVTGPEMLTRLFFTVSLNCREHSVWSVNLLDIPAAGQC